jgi:hypothetical protein
MNGPMYIPISASALSTAAELARQCSATTVRERVFVSQVVALAVREYLHRTGGLQTGAGRAAALRYVELLVQPGRNNTSFRRGVVSAHRSI